MSKLNEMLDEVQKEFLIKGMAKSLGLPNELFEGVEPSDIESVLYDTNGDSTLETATKFGILLGIGKPKGQGDSVGAGISEDGKTMQITQGKFIQFEDYQMKSGEDVKITIPNIQAKQLLNDMLNAIDAQEKGTFEEELEAMGVKKTVYVDGEAKSVEYLKKDND